MLWITPLQAGARAAPIATAQGALLVAESTNGDGYAVETTAILPDGGLLEQAVEAPDFQASNVLYLRHPDIGTAVRIAAAINASAGEGTATVDDPGSVSLNPTDPDNSLAAQLASIGDITVVPDRSARVIIDSRAGTVIAGGNIRIGEAVVSHGSMTLVIGGASVGTAAPVPGDLRMDAGATVQDVAAALHGVAAPPQAIAAVFEALRQVGALTA